MSAVGGGGATGAAIDLYARRIPNVLTLGIAATGIALAVGGFGSQTLSQALLGLVVGLVVMLPGHIFGATGAGDVKLFAAISTLLGPQGALFAFLYTALAGGAIALVVAMKRQLLYATVTRTAALMRSGIAVVGEIETAGVNRFAYAPAIALGTLAAALWR